MAEEKKAPPAATPKPLRVHVLNHEAVRELLDSVPRQFIGHIAEIPAEHAGKFEKDIKAGHLVAVPTVKGD